MNLVWKAAVLLFLVVHAVDVPAARAQSSDVWGPWYKKECRPLTIRNPVGPDRVRSPQVPIPGRGPTQECKWERMKKECPKVTNRLKNPIKCANRFQKAGWSINPPSN